MTETALVEAAGLAKRYLKGKTEVWALRSATLRVTSGEFISVTGPSGSGKSTMLHLLACMEFPTAGTYRFRGQDMVALPDSRLALVRNRYIGLVFQSYNLLPTLNAWQNVALPLVYAGVARAARKRRALEALERVGLSHRSNHFPFEMSGGEEQRVTLARAMVANPDLLLADEPTGNLDSQTQEEVVRHVLELRAAGTAVIMVTHNESLAGRADRRLKILDGQLDSDAQLGQAG